MNGGLKRGDALGDLCLWPLDSIASLREAVLRLVDEAKHPKP